MENVGYAALQIIPSFDGFEHKLTSGTSGPLRAAGASGGRTFGESAGRSMTSSITSHAKRAAFLSGAVLAAAGAAAFKLGKDSIAEARESQKVGALTTQVIKSTGGAANATAKEVGKLSTALSLKSGVDDEVIQRGANMLLTFKDIRNEVGKNNDIFNQSVAITEDMAAAMAGGQGGNGLDLKSSSILVGKALNDPAKGLTALTRVGVSFTDQQKEQIAALVKSGDTMKAQKIILGELQSEFGGAAAAQATMGEKVKTAWSNIEEQLGTALLPLLDRAEHAFLKKGVPAIQGWVDAFDHEGVPAIKHFGHWLTTDGTDKFEDFYDKAKPVADDVLPAIFDLFEASRPTLRVTAGLVGDIADGFAKIPHWAQVAIAGGLLTGKVAGFGNLARGASSLFGAGSGGLLSGVSKTAPLPVFVTNNVGGLGGAGAGLAGGAAAAAGGAALGVFPRLVPAIPVGLGSAPGQESLLSSIAHGRTGLFGQPGPKNDGAIALTPAQQSLVDLYESGDINKLTAQVKGFHDALDLAGSTKVQPELSVPKLPDAMRSLGAFISREITAGRPITPYVRVDGLASAQAQISTLISSIHAINSIGSVDVPFVHGGQGTSPTPPPGRQPVHIHLDDSGRSTLTGFMDDRVNAGMDANRRFESARPSRG